MLEFIKNNKQEVILSLVLAIMCVLAMFDLLNSNALSFIESNLNFALSNIGIVATLKIVVGILPFSDGISDILDKIFNFFFIANILIGIQYILLIINKILLAKIVIITLFFIRFIPNFRILATKILIIFLFFNPGLNIYVGVIELISNEANMQINSEIDSKISGLKTMLGITKAPEIELNLGDTRSSASKFIGELAMLGNNISEGAKKTADTLANPLDSASSMLESSKNKILNSLEIISNSLDIALRLTIKYILNVFFLYFLMPLLYFYVLYKLLSKKDYKTLEYEMSKISHLLVEIKNKNKI